MNGYIYLQNAKTRSYYDLPILCVRWPHYFFLEYFSDVDNGGWEKCVTLNVEGSGWGVS